MLKRNERIYEYSTLNCPVCKEKTSFAKMVITQGEEEPHIIHVCNECSVTLYDQWIIKHKKESDQKDKNNKGEVRIPIIKKALYKVQFIIDDYKRTEFRIATFMEERKKTTLNSKELDKKIEVENEYLKSRRKEYEEALLERQKLLNELAKWR